MSPASKPPYTKTLEIQKREASVWKNHTTTSYVVVLSNAKVWETAASNRLVRCSGGARNLISGARNDSDALPGQQVTWRRGRPIPF